MNILVTGGAGFIGSHVTDALVKDHNVYVVDNLSTGKVENLNPKATFIELDIEDKDGVISLFDKVAFDVVIHTAALARIQPSIIDPIKSHNTNVNGTLNLLEAARKHSTKFIYSGSSSAYDCEVVPTKEESPKHPKSPYALQKWIGEEYVRLYGELFDLPYVILRYFNVFGERQLTEGAYCCVAGIFLNQKAKGEPLTITGDGKQRRDFTYVRDVATANVMAIDWPEGEYNIGRGNNSSVKELADLICDNQIFIPKRPGEVMQTEADNSKARSQGWEPTLSIEEWINASKD